VNRPLIIIALLLAFAGLYRTLQSIDDVTITTAATDGKLPRYTLNDAVITRYDADGVASMRATAKTLEYFDDESAHGETLNVDVLSGVRTPWKITAPSGLLPAHGHAFMLEGDVLAAGNWPDNLEPVTVHTTQLWVDPDQHEIHTDRLATFKSVTRDGSAIGLRSNWIDRNMSLLNDVKMRYEVKK
jgi:LPS export ABC transporter protein LptC